MGKSRTSLIVGLVVGITVGVLVTWLLMKPGNIRNGISVIAPGAVYRSGQLESEQLRKEIAARGIKVVINLGSGKDWDKSACEAEGITYLPIALGDVWHLTGVPNPEQSNRTLLPPDMTAVWDALDNASAEPVLFHCWGGTHRTGTLAAMYRIQRQGWQPQDAINEMKFFGFDIDDPKYKDVLEALHQLKPTSESTARTEVLFDAAVLAESR